MIKTTKSLIVRKIEMPMTVRGFTMVDAEGIYNVYINDRLSAESAKRTMQHELDHIRNGDFDSSKPGHVLN